MGRSSKRNLTRITSNMRRIDQGIELVLCPNQPGNLWISKYACALRYEKSLEMDEKIPDDDFGIRVKAGLDICRRCPLGKRYAQLLSITEGKKSVAVKPNHLLRTYRLMRRIPARSIASKQESNYSCRGA